MKKFLVLYQSTVPAAEQMRNATPSDKCFHTRITCVRHARLFRERCSPTPPEFSSAVIAEHSAPGDTEVLSIPILTYVKIGAVNGPIDRVDAVLVSGHLAWSTHGAEYLNDLPPLPFDDEILEIVSAHLREVQDGLGRPYPLESPPSYVGCLS